jgi:hypothetical protein
MKNLLLKAFLDGPPTGPVSQTVEWEDAAGDLH